MPDASFHNKSRNIDPRKIAILMELVKEAEGKPMEQLLPLIMSTNKKLQDQNLTFTKDENEMMIDILTRNMTGKQKKQFEMIKAMMLNLNR
ncbi:MAG TPA: hypothetical protein GXZ28_02040 [Clostridiales bacterium]|jgi:hypothetical protein|nr:hypothetical protein [Clostridiales bacterium]